MEKMVKKLIERTFFNEVEIYEFILLINKYGNRFKNEEDPAGAFIRYIFIELPDQCPGYMKPHFNYDDELVEMYYKNNEKLQEIAHYLENLENKSSIRNEAIKELSDKIMPGESKFRFHDVDKYICDTDQGIDNHIPIQEIQKQLEESGISDIALFEYIDESIHSACSCCQDLYTRHHDRHLIEMWALSKESEEAATERLKEMGWELVD